MTCRLMVPFEEDEVDALSHLATSEMRALHEQVRLLVCEELVRLGLLRQGRNSSGLSAAARSIWQTRNEKRICPNMFTQRTGSFHKGKRTGSARRGVS